MHVRSTTLHGRHLTAGARMVDFAGWEMPVQYCGTLAEHRAVRSAAGLFDVSHMGELAIRGPGAAAAVDRLCANDPRHLSAGEALYTPLCTTQGGTVDDALVYCRTPGQDYLFVVNAANTATDADWMRQECLGGAVVVDESEETALLALQGPRARVILRRLLSLRERAAITALRPFTFAVGVPVAGVPCVVARTGYTGEDGVELACSAAAAPLLWDALLEAGAADGLMPCGLGARDTLRLEAALPLYGHELSRTISPLEARLARFVRIEGRDFCGRAALAEMLAAGPPRELVGLLPEPPAIARADAEVVAQDGETIGRVTSGTYAPSLCRGVALALCRTGAARPAEAGGGALSIEVRGRRVPAAVVPLPFYRRRRGA